MVRVATIVATWEDEKLIKDRFPNAPAWRQAGTEVWGNVTVPPTDAEEEEKKDTARNEVDHMLLVLERMEGPVAK
jgi:hypothetical protein